MVELYVRPVFIIVFGDHRVRTFRTDRLGTVPVLERTLLTAQESYLSLFRLDKALDPVRLRHFLTEAKSDFLHHENLDQEARHESRVPTPRRRVLTAGLGQATSAKGGRSDRVGVEFAGETALSEEWVSVGGRYKDRRGSRLRMRRSFFGSRGGKRSGGV